jgi:HK97 family phage prohead protease
MPLPQPHSDESQDDFISRCMSELTEAEEGADQKQRLAMCFSQWRERSAAPPPDAAPAGGGLLERRDASNYRGLWARYESGAHDFAPILRGYAIRFNELSERLESPFIGVFRERIRPEAIERTLAEDLDVAALIDHDPARILGRTTAKPATLLLEPDPTGLRVRIDPPNTTDGRNIVELIKRGDVSKMSFAFRTLKDAWHKEHGEDIREVYDMTIHDVSIVTFPAYRATDIAVAERSWVAAHRRPPEPRVWVPLLTHQHRQRMLEQERRRRG